MSLGLGLGFKLKGYKLGLAIPKNLRITSTTATTISYAWDASAGVDGYQFGIYEDASCTVLIELITIYGASTTTYTWDMTYFQLATNYFGRVIANGDSSITGAQRTIFYPKFKALVALGISNATVDRFWCDQYTYSAIQAATAWFWNGIGTDLATIVGSLTYGGWGVGWVKTAGAYINTNFTALTDSLHFTLNKAGIYHGVHFISSGIDTIACGAYDGGAAQTYAIDYSPGSINAGMNGGAVTIKSYSNPITNYHTKRSDSTKIKFKSNSDTENIVSSSSTGLCDIHFYRGCANLFNSTAAYYIPNGSYDQWLLIADDSFDSTLIEAI